jgi:hypothetical protein
MQLVRESSLNEYAQQFWRRQSGKKTRDDEPALSDIGKGGSPVSWLANIYPYKLPQPFNDKIDLVKFETPEELNSLLIHYSMIRDNWMLERCLVPCTNTRRLGDMAAIALERKYFETSHSDTQIKLFQRWKSKTTLTGVIEPDSYPLVENTWAQEQEIVDGWGRLHAMSALLKQGLPFEPFDCFVARRTRIEPVASADRHANDGFLEYKSLPARAGS